MKDNKLIADFMDVRNTGMSVYKEKDYKYHEDWGWLMMVVEKMNKTDLWDEWSIGNLSVCLVSADIGATYEEVVRFIKEYNRRSKHGTVRNN